MTPPTAQTTFASLSPLECRYFLRRLREARYAALADSENFTAICFVLEELGTKVSREKHSGLGMYQAALCLLIADQPSFAGNLKRLVDVRNDKSHQGVYARNAVTKAVAVCIALENYFMEQLATVEDIMVEGVTYAQRFMPLSKVRELMLAHSFSYLPILLETGTFLVADHEVARSWRSLGKKSPHRYVTRIEALIADDRIKVTPARTLPAATPLADLPIPQEPHLVTDGQGNVVGIISAFDWL